MLAIEAYGVEKSYGDKKALNGVSLNVQKGSIHALLGPNGSGKTTFVKILSTLLKPDKGYVRVGGFDIGKQGRKVREIIRLTGQNASVDEELTGHENLYLVARLLGQSPSDARKRSYELLDAFDLHESRNRLVKTYSGGMRRKLDIAASLISMSAIMFLDEPTTGLDPRSRFSVWSLIRSLAGQGTTILLTTQYLEEAENLADRISVIDHGRMISEGAPDELKASVGGSVLHVHLNGSGKDASVQSVMEKINGFPPLLDASGKKMSFPVTGHEQAVQILQRIQENEIVITGFNFSRPDLNEVFMALTGKPPETSQEDEDHESKPIDPSPDAASILMEHAQPYRRTGVLSAKLMFGWRNLVKIKHIPEQFVDALITPVMFTFMFAYIFGGALAGSVGEYLQFFIPGILVQTLTFNAMYAGINISNDVSKGIFDRFRSMPIWRPAPLSGIFIGDFFRHLISGVLVLLFGYILGYRSGAGLPAYALSFIIMIVFAMSISLVFIIMGLTMRSVSAVMSVGWIVIMPLVFMSNIFADPATMPNWLQQFIVYNPLAWQVDAVRGLLSGEASRHEIFKAFGATAAITLALFPATVFFYKKER